MDNEKRPLKKQEKIMFVIVVILVIASIISFYLDSFEALEIASPIAWMLLCVANILTNCVKWENHTKFNIILICLFGACFVFHAVILIRTLVV